MQRRSPKPQRETPQSKQPAKLNVINFAPPRLVTAGTGERKLEELRLLLDQGRAHEAQQFIARLLKPTKTNRVSTSVSAKARCALSLSLEMQGRYQESLEAVSQYEATSARTDLDQEALACVQVHLGLAYNYTGDHPKAVAILNVALRTAIENESDPHIGKVYVALARVYRSINEYTIARDYATKALEHFRSAGDWRGLAEAYFGLALANVFEGQWEAGLENLGQARALIGERPATYLLGKIHTNMAGACRALPATVFIAPRGSDQLPYGLSLRSLLRVVELGLSACALHEKDADEANPKAQASQTTSSLMPGFIHSSPQMSRLVDEIHKIRSFDVTALVTGESGTGKELVARVIHALSSRRAKVFVPFNCTAVPKELSDAFLFGYKRGAFTGAVADSAGVIRAAAGGTLFLDEVGDLPLEIQPKLLRFLQEGEIQPLGEQRPIKVDVRVIAATNSDLEEMVTAGRFREDLYYRLNVIRLEVPPLRERRSEIPAIVHHYIKHYAEKFGRRELQISPPALDLLTVYDWPGNVRQVTNEIQRIVARTEDGAVIAPEHLSPELRRQNAFAASSLSAHSLSSFPPHFDEDLTLIEAVDQFKQTLLYERLRKNNGNVSRTARELGMTRRGLQRMIVRYGLSLER